jgi:hypothetical protein
VKCGSGWGQWKGIVKMWFRMGSMEGACENDNEFSGCVKYEDFLE